MNLNRRAVRWRSAAVGVVLALGVCLELQVVVSFAAEPPPAAPAASPAPDGPRIVFDNKTKTIENLETGDTAHFAFEVRNDGNKPLEITGVQPGCGCTVAEYDGHVEPGKTGTITADVHTQALSGQVVKTLSIFSNDPLRPLETLFLVLKITPPYTVTPAGSATVSFDQPVPITRVFRVDSRHKGAFKLLGPAATAGPITVKFDAVKDSPGSYLITTIITPPAAGGDVVGQTDIPTNLAGAAPVHITVTALGQKGLCLSPSIFGFGLVQSGVPNRAQLSLFSRTSKFQIQRIELDDAALDATYREGSNAIVWYDITLSYRGKNSWTPGTHKGFITVYTDLGMAPSLKIPYHAEVQ